MKVEHGDDGAPKDDGDAQIENAKKPRKIGLRPSAREIHDDTEHEIPSEEKEPELVLAGRSLFCFGTENPFRKKVFALIAHPIFDQFILGCIILSSAFLAMDEPWVSVCACYDGSKEIPVCTEFRSFSKMFPSGPIP